MQSAVYKPNPNSLELLPIVTFDTSALNRSLDDGLLHKHMVAMIVAKRHVRFAGLSIHELVATRDADRRRALFAHCRLLHAGQSDAVHSYKELLRLLISAHVNNPSQFDWTKVPVMGKNYDDEIRDCKFVLDDDVAAKSRFEQRSRLKQFKQLLSQSRPQFESVFVAHGELQPTTFRAAIKWLENSDVKLPVLTGKWRYDLVACKDASEEAVITFFMTCPPFRALSYAYLMSQYHSLLRNKHTGEKFGAGWNDLAMSIYLPYCDQFVTNDGEQEKCLREIAAVDNLATAVLSYDDFRNTLLAEVECS